MSKQLAKKEIYYLNESYQKLLLWFFSFPNIEMSLNDISEELEISKTTANRMIGKLVEEGFLNVIILGKTWRITSNKNHLYTYSRKLSYNLTMIYESGILQKIKEIISSPRAVILFGSYRKGDDTEESDIDIAVEILGDEELSLIELGRIPQFGFRKNVLVNLHVFSRNKIDLNLFANIANGIVLEGFLELKP